MNRPHTIWAIRTLIKNVPFVKHTVQIATHTCLIECRTGRLNRDHSRLKTEGRQSQMIEPKSEAVYTREHA